MSSVDHSCGPTDEEHRAYAELTPLERLKHLDDLRLFTLMLRAAPTVNGQAAVPDPKPCE